MKYILAMNVLLPLQVFAVGLDKPCQTIVIKNKSELRAFIYYITPDNQQSHIVLKPKRYFIHNHSATITFTIGQPICIFFPKINDSLYPVIATYNRKFVILNKKTSKDAIVLNKQENDLCAEYIDLSYSENDR